jgi:hypothetical protein
VYPSTPNASSLTLTHECRSRLALREGVPGTALDQKANDNLLAKARVCNVRATCSDDGSGSGLLMVEEIIIIIIVVVVVIIIIIIIIIIKGSSTMVSNCRPISIGLLNNFSKVFEFIIYDHLYCYFKYRLNPPQHGFREHNSTTTSLVISVLSCLLLIHKVEPILRTLT